VDEAPTSTQPPSARRVAGRAAWLFLGPVQRNSLTIVRAWRRVARLLFIMRCRLTALLAHASIDLEVHPEAIVSPGARCEFTRATHNGLRIGARTRVSGDVMFSLRGGSVSIGDGTLVRRLATFQVSGDVRIGSEVLISTGVVLHCAESISVGDMTLLSEFTTVADSRHPRTPPGVPVHHAVVTAPVRIGSNVWVASHVVVTSGVNIGDQAVVGGGAVVTSDVPAGWLAAGNPARLVRELATE
jgi:acetyltransferase-like isoleucine patch superfamily enzyme